MRDELAKEFLNSLLVNRKLDSEQEIDLGYSVQKLVETAFLLADYFMEESKK